MTDHAENEEKYKLDMEKEPQHPGWVSLAKVLSTTDPFFERFHFFLGYDFSSNIYLIKGDYISIVDPGNDYTGLMDLFKQDFKPGEIKKIFLTHGHRDHCMGVFELLRCYPDVVESDGFELILHEASPSQIKDAVKEFGCRVTEVRGGETLELSGLDWEVIYTPGHTIDGISLYYAPTKTAITGDTVLPYGMADPDKNAGGRLDYYLYGVKELLKRDIEYVLPGHGVPVASAGRKVIEVAYEDVMMKIIGVEKEIPWIDGATALAKKGFLEESVFCCDKAFATDPENIAGIQLKAFCLTDLDRCAEAIPLFDKLLEQNKRDPGVLIGKGRALLGLGKYNESIKYFDEVLERDPDVKDAQVMKGMAFYLSGRYDEAMDIEGFRTEFIGRFKESLEGKMKK